MCGLVKSKTRIYHKFNFIVTLIYLICIFTDGPHAEARTSSLATQKFLSQTRK